MTESLRRRLQDTLRHLDAARALIASSTTPDAPRPLLAVGVTCVSASCAVERPPLAPFLIAATREWERPVTQEMWRALTDGARAFAAATPARITGPRHVAFVARIRLGRVDALAQLYQYLPVVRASSLVASATELLGRVVRDADLVLAT